MTGSNPDILPLDFVTEREVARLERNAMEVLNQLLEALSTGAPVKRAMMTGAKSAQVALGHVGTRRKTALAERMFARVIERDLDQQVKIGTPAITSGDVPG